MASQRKKWINISSVPPAVLSLHTWEVVQLPLSALFHLGPVLAHTASPVSWILMSTVLQHYPAAKAETFSNLFVQLLKNIQICISFFQTLSNFTEIIHSFFDSSGCCWNLLRYRKLSQINAMSVTKKWQKKLDWSQKLWSIDYVVGTALFSRQETHPIK